MNLATLLRARSHHERQPMPSILSSIDKAVKVCGTARKLAAMLGMHEATLAAVRAGKRGLTPLQVVKLAEITDEDAKDLLACDAIARAPDTATREVLREGFFHRGIAGAAAICFAIATAFWPGAADASGQGYKSALTEIDKRYIVVHWLRALARLVGLSAHRLSPATV